MIQEYQLRVLPQIGYNETNLKAYLAEEKGLDLAEIYRVRVLKRSVDARHRDIYINLNVRVYINEFPQDDVFQHTEYKDVSKAPAVIVVGEASCRTLCLITINRAWLASYRFRTWKRCS